MPATPRFTENQARTFQVGPARAISFEQVKMLNIHRNLSTENTLGGDRQSHDRASSLLNSAIDVGLQGLFGVTDQATNFLERRSWLLPSVPLHAPFTQLG